MRPWHALLRSWIVYFVFVFSFIAFYYYYYYYYSSSCSCFISPSETPPLCANSTIKPLIVPRNDCLPFYLCRTTTTVLPLLTNICISKRSISSFLSWCEEILSGRTMTTTFVFRIYARARRIRRSFNSPNFI